MLATRNAQGQSHQRGTIVPVYIHSKPESATSLPMAPQPRTPYFPLSRDRLRECYPLAAFILVESLSLKGIRLWYDLRPLRQ